MYIFRFIYIDGTYQDYPHIKKAEYTELKSNISVIGEDIFDHVFPLEKDIRLYSDIARYLVSGKNVKSISITKEAR